MKTTTAAPSYKHHRYPAEIIAYTVWLYFRFSLRFGDVEELMAARGHTLSAYAPAFAAVSTPIPAVLTALADAFGGPIPCGAFALIGDDAIGNVVVESIGRPPAVLLKNHGVFTIGKHATAAVNAAVMPEKHTKTVWLALQIGPLM